MKYAIIISAVIWTISLPGISTAQSRMGDVVIGRPAIEKDGELVTVRFTAEAATGAAPRNHSLIFGPELTDGTYRWSLPVMIVQGKGSRAALDRRIHASGNRAQFENAVVIRNGTKTEYFAAAPYQQWMEGATLSIEAVRAGCCSSSPVVSETLALDLKLQPEEEPVVTADPAPVPVPALTTGDSLAVSYPHIMPLEMYEPTPAGGLFNDERHNTITVHYAQGRYDIDSTMGDNLSALGELLSSVRTIMESPDSDIAVVVIAGFASPEGSFDFNDKLAWNRAASVKEYITRHTGLGADRIELFNGSEDWQGLRMLVEASDMPAKTRILQIIDTVPVWDAPAGRGRLGELMRLDGGGPYRYMYEHFFPRLRNSAYIRVYYKNTNR